MDKSLSLPVVGESSCGSNSVPVFNCVVILSLDEAGRISARVANLPGIQMDGMVERDLLFAITRRFKAKLQEYVTKDQPIPWIDPVPRAAGGEYERFIPLHL